jgi:hypothetical protein
LKPHKRQKRGLINIFGEIGHTLFGLATDDQVTAVCDVVEQLRERSGAVGHAIDQLTTVVNRTAMYVRENRKRLEELRMQEMAVQRYIQSWSRAYNKVVETLRIIETRLEMERVLEALELAVDIYSADVDQYRRERVSLEAGRLTEELLPAELLAEVLAESRKFRVESVARIEWYYETMQIEPVWGDEDTLMYYVKIPLVDPTRYLHYTISTWPVPYQDEDLSAHLQIERQFGFDTRSGDIFVPHNCLGQYPMVCRSGPLFNSNALQCPRGILTNDPELRKTCIVTLIKGHNKTTITQVNLNEYIIVTWGEKYIERCSGLPEISNYLSTGVHLLTVNESCVLNGKSWAVRGVIQRQSHASIISQKVPDIDPVQLQIKIPASDVIALFKTNPLNALTEMEKVSLDKITLPPVMTNNWLPPSKHVNWIVLAIIIISCTGPGVAIIVVCRRKMKFCKQNKQTKRTPIRKPYTEISFELEERQSGQDTERNT